MSFDLIGLSALAAILCFAMALGCAKHNAAWAAAGMLTAFLSGLLMPNVVGYTPVVGAVVIGGAAGTLVAKKVKPAAFDKIFDLFRSATGLAAVLACGAALKAPAVYAIGTPGLVPPVPLAELGLAAALGALVLAGSVTALLRRQGLIAAVQVLPMAVPLKLGLGLALAFLLAWQALSESMLTLLLLASAAAGLGYLLIRQADDEDLPAWAGLLNGALGLSAACLGFMMANTLLVVAGGLALPAGWVMARSRCKSQGRTLSGLLSGR